MDQELENILNDKVSGSSSILNNVITFLINKLESNQSISNDITLILAKLDHFPVVVSHISRILDMDKNKEEILEYLVTLIRNEKQFYELLFNKIKKHLKDDIKIFTLSKSKTVLEVVKQIDKHYRNVQLFVSESKPGGEGIILHQEFLQSGIDSYLIDDNEMKKRIEQCDLVIIGCDAILPNKSIINKVKSFDAASISKELGKPFIVVGSKSKLINNEEANLLLIKKTNETSSEAAEYMFEIVPAELITELITD